jgi:hypothetical protein
MVSIDRSYVATPSGSCLDTFKISFLYQIFRFSFLSVASLHCELIWALRLSVATCAAPYCVALYCDMARNIPQNLVRVSL